MLLIILLFLGLERPIQAQAIQAPEMNDPILPSEFWERYADENTALAKAESGSPAEQRKAAVTLFLLSRGEKDKDKALELALESSKIMKRIYRSNDLLLTMLSGKINMGVAGKSSKIADRITYTNRGLADYEVTLPNIPENLEARQTYLRTTIYIPRFFKNLGSEQWEHIKIFVDKYDAAMQQPKSPEDRKHLRELKTHVMIMAAHIAKQRRSTRKDVGKYLAQVDTSFFANMRADNNDDLVKMYEKLKG